MGEQEKRRQYLIQALLRERPEYEAMEIPMQEDEQRQLLRGLMNIRAPRRCSEEFLRIFTGSCEGKRDSGMTGCYVPNHKCIDNCIHSFAGV